MSRAETAPADSTEKMKWSARRLSSTAFSHPSRRTHSLSRLTLRSRKQDGISTCTWCSHAADGPQQSLTPLTPRGPLCRTPSWDTCPPAPSPPPPSPAGAAPPLMRVTQSSTGAGGRHLGASDRRLWPQERTSCGPSQCPSEHVLPGRSADLKAPMSQISMDCKDPQTHLL